MIILQSKCFVTYSVVYLSGS